MAQIEYKQYDGHTISAVDDRILYDHITWSNGVIFGGDLSFINLNIIHIEECFGMLKGGLFHIEEQDIECQLPTAPGKGQIYIHLDMSDTETPAKLLTRTVLEGEDFPELIQDENMNFDDGIWEFELGIYRATNISVLSVEKSFEILKNGVNVVGGMLEGYGDRHIEFPTQGGIIAIEYDDGGNRKEVIELPNGNIEETVYVDATNVPIVGKRAIFNPDGSIDERKITY